MTRVRSLGLCIVVIALLIVAVPGIAEDSRGVAWSWGNNESGKLGRSAVPATPFPIDDLDGVTEVAAGSSHALALLSDGTVWAWGAGDEGQLGNGSFTDSEVPVRASALSGVVSIAAGYDHNLALKSDGTVWSWGSNNSLQLGTGTYEDSSIARQVSNLNGVVGISAGQAHSVALKSDGSVWSWGWGGDGQLGNGDPFPNWTPIKTSISGAVSVAAGGRHSLAVLNDGSVWAWGKNEFGEIGSGKPVGIGSSLPVKVEGIAAASAVAAGYYHSLALLSDGTARAWGDNRFSQLGNGLSSLEMRYSSTPVIVNNLNGIGSISAGFIHSLALKGDGTVWAWGFDASGERGWPLYPGLDYYSPNLALIAKASDVAAGGNFSLAVSCAGSLQDPGFCLAGG